MGTLVIREMNVYTDTEWTEISSTEATEDDYLDAYADLHDAGWSVMRSDSGASYRTSAFHRDEISRDITYCYPDNEAREREQRFYPPMQKEDDTAQLTMF